MFIQIQYAILGGSLTVLHILRAETRHKRTASLALFKRR